MMPAAAARAWDEYDAYLFDIDGTLLNCTDAVHYFAFCHTLTMLAGRPLNLDGVIAHGNTDIGILRDALTIANVPEDTWRPLLQEAREVLCQEVQRHEADLQISLAPRVNEVLLHLHARGAVLGVATGNLACIGRIKLKHAGLLHHFDFCGYSDLYEYRRDVFAGALHQASEVAGEHAAVCVVGDTPTDIQAAQANGLDVIAVATGIYSREQLLVEDPTICVRSFNDLDLQLSMAEIG